MTDESVGIGESRPTGRGAVRIDVAAAHRARLMQAGQMLAGVVHEINNPLAVIHGYAQLLLERARNDEDRHDLNALLGETQRLTLLIEDMLSFTRRGTDAVEVVDLGRVVGATINLSTHAMRQARVAVVASLPEDPPQVRGQLGAYVQVLLNLLTNARQSLEAGRRDGRGVSIRVEDAGAGRTRLLVANNGPPIPAELRPRIFEPFFTTKPEGEGCGLGLALCREIMERYDGELDLLASDDEGVTFRLDFANA